MTTDTLFPVVDPDLVPAEIVEEAEQHLDHLRPAWGDDADDEYREDWS